jgi:hypothetical protein
MELDTLVNRFRICSRELFNQYFRIDDPYHQGGWDLEARYRDLEAMLFQKLVLEPSDLPEVPYRTFHPNIGVEIRSDPVPMMLNRHIDSGYWDHPLTKVGQDAVLGFVSFFDWDQLDYRDHRYVRVRIISWPSHKEAIAKHAFIESHYVRFVRRDV